MAGILSNLFANPETYDAKIRAEIPRQPIQPIVTTAELLKLSRLSDTITWNLSSIHQCFIPHRMELKTSQDRGVVIWGYRAKEDCLKSYISAPGCLMEFEAKAGRCFFTVEGKTVAEGGSVFSDTFNLCFDGARSFRVMPPKRRSDWNSAYQKPSFILVEENNQPVCRLILQPFRAVEHVVHDHSIDAASLPMPTMLALVSLSVILNARFEP